jgi:hypothetical protein
VVDTGVLGTQAVEAGPVEGQCLGVFDRRHGGGALARPVRESLFAEGVAGVEPSRVATSPKGVVRRTATMHAIFATDTADTVPLTQADIASMAGVTRSTVNRVLRAAQTKGVLRAGRATLEIVDVERLHRLAGL